MTDDDYENDLAFVASKPSQAKPMLQSLKQAAVDIVLYENANNTEFIRFKKEWNILSHLPNAEGSCGQFLTGYRS